MSKTKSILVPTTGMGVASETADYVMKVARALGGNVLELHIIRPGHASEYAEHVSEVFDQAGKEAGVEVKCAVREGAVVNEIIDFAEKNDVSVILMGACNGEILDDWINSDIRNQTTIPVLIIPYQAFDNRRPIH